MEKDIVKVLLKYTRYWYYFLLASIICVALAFLYLRYEVTPEYYISGKILLNDKENGGGDASGLESFSNLGLIKTSSNIQDQIGILQSYDLMKQTIDELGLAVGYYIEGRFSEVEVYEPTLPFRVRVDDSLQILQYGTIGSVLVLDTLKYQLETIDSIGNKSKQTYSFEEKIITDFGEFYLSLNEENYRPGVHNAVIVRFRDTYDLALNYNFKLGVNPVFDKSGGGLLQLDLTDAIPRRGIDIINRLIDVYARNSSEHKNILANATLKLIDERLELLTSDLDIAEKGIEDYKQSKNLTDVSSDASRFIRLADEADRDLRIVDSEIYALTALESSLSQVSSSNFSTISSSVNNAALIGAISRFNEKVQERNGLIAASGLGNPMLASIDKQLLNSKNLILSNVRSVKQQLLKQQREITNKSAQFKSRISSVPTAERALLGINRDQGIKQQIYLYLLQKREEEALSISVPFSDTRIIETPTSSSYPVNGAKTPIYLGAILLGLFVPFTVLFAKSMINTTLLEKEQIADLTNTPILGVISSNKGKETIVVSNNKITPVAELFRLLRHNLKFLSQGTTQQVIMVTSGKQGEGKTFVSINLGSSLAITGKKVIILGFDLRVPKLMKDVSLKYEQGLSDFIIDSSISSKDIIVQHDKIENLSFIGSGSIPPNPGELMLNERVTQLIEALKKNYDYIIIDTPPIGKVADAYALGPLVDSTLFVVRYNYTKQEELSVVNEIQENKRLKSLMIVFNDFKIDKSGAYSYGYGGKSK